MPGRDLACPSCGKLLEGGNRRPAEMVGATCKGCGAVITLKDVELWMKQTALENAKRAIAERTKPD